MKRYIFNNKQYKIVVEYLPLSILIQVFIKKGIRGMKGMCMSAISETTDELALDYSMALYYLRKSKPARRWFKNKINLSFYDK